MAKALNARQSYWTRDETSELSFRFHSSHSSPPSHCRSRHNSGKPAGERRSTVHTHSSSVIRYFPSSYSLFTDPFSTAGEHGRAAGTAGHTVVCICPHRTTPILPQSSLPPSDFLALRRTRLLSLPLSLFAREGLELDSPLDLTHLLRWAGRRRTAVGKKESRDCLTLLSLCPPWEKGIFHPPSTYYVRSSSPLSRSRSHLPLARGKDSRRLSPGPLTAS